MQVTTSELQIGRGAGNVPAGANQMCMEQAALKLAGGGAEIRLYKILNLLLYQGYLRLCPKTNRGHVPLFVPH
jgi:hypothetical protein